ncbi:hypothetical protein [Variovorax saccharolyticus]|uniref:hypothetical protein n=1 Tax=Variovorax saccharolyticus TaxID=3053516 RepID=UPI00257695AA|nr:hypothetical protein [Variovorax sp. J31P216]MDM0024110.1 hypothetical protein [Variovorax sp. J31P216]
MELAALNIARSLCSLFEVFPDERGVQRVVTPLEYPGSGERVVVRVRPAEGGGFEIDENGESAMYAQMAGGDVDSDTCERWAHDLLTLSPVVFEEDETLRAFAPTERHIAPYIIRVAEAAQQLHALATSRAERKSSDFKKRLAEIVEATALRLKLPLRRDLTLPLAGGLEADHIVEAAKPIIIVAANSPTRLLEAEVIYMQFRSEKRPGRVIAIAESQQAVGKKQFERAGYYTDRTVAFEAESVERLIQQEAEAA